MPNVREGCNLTIIELATRIRGVLRDLSMLSGADAVHYDGDRLHGGGGGSKSQPPPGVRFGRRDLRDLSLAEYWGARFQSVRGDVEKLTFFLFLAERDLHAARHRVEPVDPHERAEDRIARVLEQYEGLSATEAAVVEGTEPVWIKAIRMRNERDPETGWLAPNIALHLNTSMPPKSEPHPQP